MTEPGVIVVAALVAARLLPVAIAVPVLGGPLAPWPARLALTAMAAIALALVQPPAAAAAAALPASALAALALKELAVGAVLAAIVSVPFVAADTAGRWIGVALGPADAGTAAIGPTGPTRATGLVVGLLAVVVFLGIDGHLVVIAAIARSYEVVPLAGGLDAAAAARELVAALVALLGAAVALAAPALVAAALVDLVAGLAIRAGLPGGAAAALRAAALVAFLAASLLLLSIALARGLSASAATLEAALPTLGG